MKMDLSAKGGWMRAMDLTIGEEVMLVPVAGGGNGFQGTLVDMVCGPAGPLVFVIERIGSPKVSINWANMSMITRVVGPGAKTVTPADLVKLADESGYDVPDEVRGSIADMES